jgi:hypothetical protein
MSVRLPILAFISDRMTSVERKHNSEKLLLSLGISLKDNLPPVEEEDVITLRSAQEIAERIVILTYLNCVATDPSLQQQVMMFLIHEGLWDKATEEEKALFHKTQLTEEDITIIFWRAESIWLLLWSINKIRQLDLPEKEVNLHEIFPFLPGFLESTKDFIQTAAIRSVSEILDQYDLVFRLNWAFQEAHTQGTGTLSLNAGIAYERYFSITWVTRTREVW